MKSELEDFINNNIEAFHAHTPDPAVLDRIQQQMKVSRRKKEKVITISFKLRWAVAACIILLAGTVAFFAIQKDEALHSEVASIKKAEPVIEQETIVVKTILTPITDEAPILNVVATKPTTDIEEEAYLHKKLLFAKLNNQESPSQRLTAVMQIGETASTDKDIVDALAKTMNTDPNTNVRLAALEALSKFHREAYVKKKLLSSLQKQTDPMVQISLIELLTKMKELSILKQLNKIVNDEKTMQAVKEQAYTGILTLSL